MAEAKEQLHQRPTVTAIEGDDLIAVSDTSDGKRLKAMSGAAFRSDLDQTHQNRTEKGANSGYCDLDANGKIPNARLNTSAATAKGDWRADNTSPVLNDGTGTAGDEYDVVDDNGGTIAQGAGTLSVNGQSVVVGDQIKYDGALWFIKPKTANVLDGNATAAQARTTLGTPSNDELARHGAADRVSLRLDGAADYANVPDKAALSFTDGVDDLPFSILARVRMTDATLFPIVSKDPNTPGDREYVLSTQGGKKLWFVLLTDNSNFWVITSTEDLSSYEGQWIDVAVTYAGSGPNNANSFSNAAAGVTVYINSKAISTDGGVETGVYAGMSNGAKALEIGKWGSNYAEGEFHSVRLYNMALSAADVEAETREGRGYATDKAAATATHQSNFSGDSADSYTGSGGTLSSTVTVGGEPDCVQLTVNNANTTHYIRRGDLLARSGHYYLVSFDVYVPSGNSVLTGIQIQQEDFGLVVGSTKYTPTADTWTRITEIVAKTGSVDNASIRFLALAGSSGTFQDAGGDDTVAIRNVVVEEAGAILDLDIAAANPDATADHIPDRSGNGFHASVVSVGRDGLAGAPAGAHYDVEGASAGQAVLSVSDSGGGNLKLTKEGRAVFGGSSLDGSAAVQVDSTSGGFLLPRMTTTQRDAISTPANGLIFYNTTTNKVQARANGVWADLH